MRGVLQTGSGPIWGKGPADIGSAEWWNVLGMSSCRWQAEAEVAHNC